VAEPAAPAARSSKSIPAAEKVSTESAPSLEQLKAEAEKEIEAAKSEAAAHAHDPVVRESVKDVAPTKASSSHMAAAPPASARVEAAPAKSVPPSSPKVEPLDARPLDAY
jgi:hypothetical protein